MSADSYELRQAFESVWSQVTAMDDEQIRSVIHDLHERFHELHPAAPEAEKLYLLVTVIRYHLELRAKDAKAG